MIKEKRISVAGFREVLGNICQEVEPRHKEFFRNIDTELGSVSAVKGLWDRLCVCWNYFNSSLLEYVIAKFGDETLRTDMEVYKKTLKYFQSRTCITTVSFENLPQENFKQLAVKLDPSWKEHVLEDLETLSTDIAKNFHIPSFVINFQSITTPDCVHVTWSIPAVIGAALKEKMGAADTKEFCKGHGITSMTIEECTYAAAKRCPSPLIVKPMEKKVVECDKFALREGSIRPDCHAQFMDYMSSNPFMNAAMHIPVIAEIVVDIFEWSRDTESTLPTTMTQLYTAFTCKLLMQHFSSCKEEGSRSEKFRSLEEVPADVKGRLLELCSLAWGGTVDQQLAFNSQVAGRDTLGLMYKLRKDDQLSYHFIHPALQDFLSAYHITQFSPEVQEGIIRANSRTKHWNMVLKFYFGLNELDRFTTRMMAERLSEHDEAVVYHWLFEVANVSKIDEALGTERRVLVQPLHSWRPLDYYVLGCAVASCQFQWELAFKNISVVGDECVKMLCRGMADKCRPETTYKGKIEADFGCNNISLEGIKCLASIPLQMAQHIYVIYLSENQLDINALNAFCEVIPKLTKLQILSLCQNPIGRCGAVEALKCLHHCRTPLKELNLSATGMGKEDCEQLALVIANTDLVNLDISLNDLSSNSVASIISGLMQNNTIEELNIDNSHFSVENCRSMVSFIPQARSLRKIDMDNCSIDERGLVHIARAMTSRQDPISWGLPCDLMDTIASYRRALQFSTVS